MGAQCNDTHAQHGQRPHEWGPPQCKYYGSVKHNDPAALILSNVKVDCFKCKALNTLVLKMSSKGHL